MGCRFQVYYIHNDKEFNLKKTIFHIQWCYGYETIYLLEQILWYTEKHADLMGKHNFFINKKYECCSDECVPRASVTLLQSITSVVYRVGTFLNARPIEPIAECNFSNNPRLVENDSGILIIDLRKPKPRYCLMDRNFRILEPNEYFNIYKGNYRGDSLKYLEDIPEAMENISKFEKITLDEIKKFFPRMYEGEYSS